MCAIMAKIYNSTTLIEQGTLYNTTNSTTTIHDIYPKIKDAVDQHVFEYIGIAVGVLIMFLLLVHIAKGLCAARNKSKNKQSQTPLNILINEAQDKGTYSEKIENSI
jgi:hypothetical protein